MPHPNVLFIAVEDLSTVLSCYGHPQVKTPNIDRFAESAVRFDRAYCQYPLCNPSRASVLTGRRPDATGVRLSQENNTRHFRDKLPDVVTLPQFFQKQGYFAARVGKIYHYGVPREIGTVSALDDAPSWNLALYPRGAEKDEEHLLHNCTPDRHPGWGLCWHESDSPGDEHTDGKVATETIKLLEKHKDGPFFIAAGFYRPHTPCIAPKRFFDLYPPDEVQLPDEPPEHLKKIPSPAFDPIMQVSGASEECLRGFRRGYFASVSYVDEQVGRVIDAVEKLGLADNTVVVFWSDHGCHLGEHGQWLKPTLFEETTRVPLMIRSPGMRGNGKACFDPVEMVNLYPTVVELCGFQTPDDLDGRSLRPVLENPATDWDLPAFSQVGRGRVQGRSVRMKSWRYTEWNQGNDGRELYDHASDPNETDNLADDPKHADTVAELSGLLSRQFPSLE